MRHVSTCPGRGPRAPRRQLPSPGRLEGAVRFRSVRGFWVYNTRQDRTAKPLGCCVRDSHSRTEVRWRRGPPQSAALRSAYHKPNGRFRRRKIFGAGFRAFAVKLTPRLFGPAGGRSPRRGRAPSVIRITLAVLVLSANLAHSNGMARSPMTARSGAIPRTGSLRYYGAGRLGWLRSWFVARSGFVARSYTRVHSRSTARSGRLALSGVMARSRGLVHSQGMARFPVMVPSRSLARSRRMVPLGEFWLAPFVWCDSLVPARSPRMVLSDTLARSPCVVLLNCCGSLATNGALFYAWLALLIWHTPAVRLARLAWRSPALWLALFSLHSADRC